MKYLSSPGDHPLTKKPEDSGYTILLVVGFNCRVTDFISKVIGSPGPHQVIAVAGSPRTPTMIAAPIVQQSWPR